MSNQPTLNFEQTRELKKLLESITHSGRTTICQDELQVLLKLMENGEPYVTATFGILKKYLKKDHAEVRFSTVQLYDELLTRYESFMDLVLERLDKFFKFAIGIKNELPPPKAAAANLVALAIGVFDQWHSRFGSNCIKLRNGYKLLKEVHNVDFQSRSFIDPKVKKEKEENRQRLLKINKERLKNHNKLIEELMPEIEASLTSIDSCFELLLPSDHLKADEIDEDPNKDYSDLRLYGVLNPRDFKVEIQLDDKVTIVEDEENSPILEAANDSFKIIKNSFLPKVIAWVELISVAEGERDMKDRAIALKSKLSIAVSKYEKLHVVKPSDKVSTGVDDVGGEEVSSDSDLEEVAEPKRDKRVVTREEIGFLSERMDLYTSNKLREDSDPGSSSGVSQEKLSISRTEVKKEINERKAELMKIAPKLPYDMDLYYWEEEKLPTLTLIPKNTEGKFWGTTLADGFDEIPVPGGSESLRTRVIEFSGKFEPVARSCRAPLPSGKLCPRHDRLKCPHHGLIVDRDEEGNIVNPEDEEKVRHSKKKPEIPDWQDPKLLADIKAATGVDLKMPVKGQRAKRKKHPGLADIKPKMDTPEARLSKKVFNRGSMKRVAATLDKLDHKRFRDKFGDQFNYIHDT